MMKEYFLDMMTVCRVERSNWKNFCLI